MVHDVRAALPLIPVEAYHHLIPLLYIQRSYAQIPVMVHTCHSTISRWQRHYHGLFPILLVPGGRAEHEHAAGDSCQSGTPGHQRAEADGALRVAGDQDHGGAGETARHVQYACSDAGAGRRNHVASRRKCIAAHESRKNTKGPRTYFSERQ